MTTNEKLYKAISNIAYGFIFILIHIKIGPFDILPDFVGFILITRSVISLKDECKTIRLLKPLGIFLAVWKAAELLLSFTDVMTILMAIHLPSVVTIINIYFYFQLFTDISLIAEKYQPEGSNFNKKLITGRNIYIITETIIFLLTYLILNTEALAQNDLSAYILAPVSIINLIVLILIASALFSFRKIFKAEEGNAESPDRYAE